MKKLQSARTFVSVTVAGITGSSIYLVSDKITGINLESSVLVFIILVPALFITYFPFQWLATYALNFERIRKWILKQDYVEGYWLVDNCIGGHVISTGFMHYQIVDEKLNVSGTHFLHTGDQKSVRTIANTSSISADCYKGDYYNHFRIPGVGLGVANGKFCSTGRGGSIPDNFQVEVVVATTPDSVLEWWQNAPDWVSAKEVHGFTSLSNEENKELIYSMAKGKVVTMHQHGVRISKMELDNAMKADPVNYQKVLANEHYAKFQTKAS